MTKCHAVPAKTIKLSYGSGPLRPPGSKTILSQKRCGEFVQIYEFTALFFARRATARVAPTG